ncbi:MAG: 3-phosphoshikimate 1-carboxyvinyltransferase, partial [Thermoplasmata archaeon]
MGARVRVLRDRWEFQGAGALRPVRASRWVRCGSSGTTLRFLLSAAALSPERTRLTGSAELGRRPVDALLATLVARGATLERRGAGGGWSISIRGAIAPGRFSIRASESSQFLSSLLLVLPRLGQRSTLVARGPIVSRPYVDATLALLRANGVGITAGAGGWEIPAPVPYRLRSFSVPGDASSAAPLWVAAVVSGGSASIGGMDARWPQADLAILDLLRSAGAEVRLRGTRALVRSGRLEPFRFNFDDCPDLLPLGGVLAAYVDSGESRLEGGAHARRKESDRLRETARLAHALGARVRLRRSAICVRRGTLPARLRYRPPT